MSARIIAFPVPRKGNGWTKEELELLYKIAETAITRRFSSGSEVFCDDEGNPAFSVMSVSGDAFQTIFRFDDVYLIMDRWGQIIDSDNDLCVLLSRSYYGGDDLKRTEV